MSIALLGGVGLAVMTGLIAAVIGSRTEQEHSRAQEWLQSATEVLVNDVGWLDCTTDTPANLAAAYEAAINANTAIIPPDWVSTSARLVVPVPVQYPYPSGAYGAPCDADENRQKIVIQVENPDSAIIETVEVVKVP